MTCTEALELLLEADPETLAGRGESALASHLRSCADCQLVAARLLIVHQDDSTEYLSVAVRQTPKAIAELVMATPRVAAPAQRRRQSMVRWIGACLVPLAAAATVVLVADARRNVRREALQASIDAAFAAGSSVTNVKVPPGRNAVVFKTRDPSISVIWIY